jgi:hypothetical protein
MTHRSGSRCVFASHPTCWRLADGRKLGSFSCSIPPSFVLSHNMPMTNTTSNWLRFGAFLSPLAPSFRIHWPQFSRHSPLATRHSPLATRHSPLATRHSPLATTSYDPPPLATLPPTAELQRPNGTRSRRALPLCYYVTEPGDSCGQIKQFFLFPLAADQPLTILSWQEALNATSSRRACRMAIRRNVCPFLDLF